MDLMNVELKEDATDTDLYILAGRKKKSKIEEDRAKHRARYQKEGGQRLIQALPFPRHNCWEPLVTDDFHQMSRLLTSTQTHTHSFTAYTYLN